MDSDAVLARELAAEVGEALLAARADLLARFDGPAVKDAGDALAQAIVARRLGELRPDDAVLSEEAADDLARLDAERVWIIDPLDGTKEYAREGRIDWAVHVALWDARANAFAAAAVSLPAQGMLLDTISAADGVPPRTAGPDGPVRIVASGSRTPVVLEDIAAAMPIEVHLWGSAGAKAARVISGDVDAYVHDTSLNEWDSAAPVGVALAYGLHVSGLDGRPLLFNQRVPKSGDILMCRPELADALLRSLADDPVSR